MALDIQLPPYTLDSVLVRDSYLTHYQATGAGQTQYIATEFYPTYMADRAPNGALQISDRFTKEFDAELTTFKARAAKMGEVQGSILPIEGVVERNNTAYVIRRACGFTTVESYMNGQQMHFIEAFQFMRPLMLSLGLAQASGVVFNFSIKDLRVTPQRQLMLDATFAWDLNFHPSLVEIAKLYFKLITGHTYTKEQPSPRDYGVAIPPRLEEIFNEVLSGNDILYGSLDDFYKRVKREIDAELGNVSAANASKSGKMMGAAVFVLTLLVTTALGGLVYGGVLAYRAYHSWVNTDFAEPIISAPIFDFTPVALTHPRDVGDPLSGAFHFYDIFLFSRSDWGRPVLVRRRIGERALTMPGVVVTEEEEIFLDNVQPSFITSWSLTETLDDGRERLVRSYLFFTDGLRDNRIYRTTLTGTARDVTRVTEHTALHLTVVGDYLYFANYDRGNILYRVDTHTLEARPVFNRAVFGTATDGEHLFFLSGEEGGPFEVFMMHPDAPTHIVPLAADAGVNLVYDGNSGQLFFSTPEGWVRAVAPAQETTVTPYESRTVADWRNSRIAEAWDGIRVQTFTVDGNYLIFTEQGSLVPQAIHRQNGDRIVLDAARWLVYVWAHNGVLYGIDHVNRNLTHTSYLP